MLNEDILLSILKNNFDKVITIIDEERPCYVETFDVLTITKDELKNSDTGNFVVDSINLKESDEYILEFGGRIIKGEIDKDKVDNHTINYIYFYDDYIGYIYVGDKVISDEGMENSTYNETTAMVTLDDIYLPFEEFTDIKLKKLNIKPLSNDLLEKDLVIQNSISLGRVEDSKIGKYSCAIGEEVTASNYASHAEGITTTASGSSSHAEGYNTTASGDDSHAEGNDTNASGHHSHAEGGSTTANGYASHAEGGSTTASGYYSHAEGQCTTSNSDYSHAEGNYARASGTSSHAEGDFTIATGNASHAEGTSTTASNTSSHAEGFKTTASGYYSHGEGCSTTASGSSSHAEGYSSNKVTNVITSFSTSTSDDTIITQWKDKKFSLAKGKGSHIEGIDNLALGESSHAEGKCTTASGYVSHAEGDRTTASGDYSHTEGKDTKASGICSHAEGYNTKASGQYQHVQGKYNIEDTTHKYAHIVGNGNSKARSNAHTLDWNGNAWYQGNVSIDGTPTNDNDLITKGYVDSNIEFYPVPISEGSELNLSYKFINLNNLESGKTYVMPRNIIISGKIPFFAINDDGSGYQVADPNNILGFSSAYGGTLRVYMKSSTSIWLYFQSIALGTLQILLSKKDGVWNHTLAPLSLTSSNTIEYIPKKDYNPATKKYVDDLESKTLTTDNITEYTPTSDYHPTTKKYVDESVGNVLTTTNNVEGTLQLTTARNQTSTLAIDTEILMPEGVTDFTEIHLFFAGIGAINIGTGTTVVKWNNRPVIEEGKTYELIFTHINDVIGWIGDTIVYN